MSAWSAVDGGFQALAGLERRNLRRGDLDLRAGLRISPDARGAGRHREDAEAGQPNRVTVLESLRDGAEHGVHGLRGIALGDWAISSFLCIVASSSVASRNRVGLPRFFVSGNGGVRSRQDDRIS